MTVHLSPLPTTFALPTGLPYLFSTHTHCSLVFFLSCSYSIVLCVFFLPGLTLAANDDEAGPSNRPDSPPPKTREELLDGFLESIAECQQELKKAKAAMAKALAVTSNPTKPGAYVEE